MQQSPRITGSLLNYYFICHRKLWYFSKHITMENNSELVSLGKVLDENSYSKEKKSICIDNTINIDFIDSKGIINEVKKSDEMEDSHIWQLKYYLYYLQNKGIKDLVGSIDYPKLRKKIRIELSQEDCDELDNILEEIEKLLILEVAPGTINSKICKKCSYYELCYI